VDQHRPLVDCLINGVIIIFKALACQHPIVWLNGKSSPCLLFYTLDLSGRTMMMCGFTTFPIGYNQLWLIVNNLFETWKKSRVKQNCVRGWDIHMEEACMVQKWKGIVILFFMGSKFYLLPFQFPLFSIDLFICLCCNWRGACLLFGFWCGRYN
jgi:hypothetical protein